MAKEFRHQPGQSRKNIYTLDLVWLRKGLHTNRQDENKHIFLISVIEVLIFPQFANEWPSGLNCPENQLEHGHLITYLHERNGRNAVALIAASPLALCRTCG